MVVDVRTVLIHRGEELGGDAQLLGNSVVEYLGRSVLAIDLGDPSLGDLGLSAFHNQDSVLHEHLGGGHHDVQLGRVLSSQQLDGVLQGSVACVCLNHIVLLCPVLLVYHCW